MIERKRCAKCERAIDAISTICPFCNWDQSLGAPPPEVLNAPSRAAALYKPPEEFRLKRVILIGAGILVMLIGAFGIGMVINSDDAPDKAPESLEEQAAEHNKDNLKPRRADTPLVPAGEGGIDQTPITSAPTVAPEGGAMPNEYARTDATAVSAVEYAQMAKLAQAEKKKPASIVDPRTLSGPAYAQGPQARVPVRRPASTATTPGGAPPPQYSSAPAAPARRVVRTKPVPEYQPLPSVRGSGKARLTLIVGTDGHVRDVNVERTLPGGNTPALISAVQKWRFKPATEDGEPVAAPYTVEIQFGRE
jgi:TonB family protein